MNWSFWIEIWYILGTSRYDTLYTYYNITFIQLVNLCCHLLTDKQAKMYAKRKLNTFIESWNSKGENLNTRGRVSKLKKLTFFLLSSPGPCPSPCPNIPQRWVRAQKKGKKNISRADTKFTSIQPPPHHSTHPPMHNS